MAEFCLDCWNRINKTKYDERKYVISKDLDLCEGCGERKHVIVMERNGYWRCGIVYFLQRMLRKLYWLLKTKTKKPPLRVVFLFGCRTRIPQRAGRLTCICHRQRFASFESFSINYQTKKDTLQVSIFVGCRTRIRTQTNRVRVCRATFTQFGNDFTMIF